MIGGQSGTVQERRRKGRQEGFQKDSSERQNGREENRGKESSGKENREEENRGKENREGEQHGEYTGNPNQILYRSD